MVAKEAFPVVAVAQVLMEEAVDQVMMVPGPTVEAAADHHHTQGMMVSQMMMMMHRAGAGAGVANPAMRLEQRLEFRSVCHDNLVE